MSGQYPSVVYRRRGGFRAYLMFSKHYLLSVALKGCRLADVRYGLTSSARSRHEPVAIVLDLDGSSWQLNLAKYQSTSSFTI